MRLRTRIFASFILLLIITVESNYVLESLYLSGCNNTVSNGETDKKKDELERLWKDVIVARFWVLSLQSPRMSEESHVNVTQDCRCLDSNRSPPEYK
jgi:hypothetical protein